MNKQTAQARAAKLTSEMTLDEKLAQIGSYWMYDLQTRGELDMQKVKEKLGFGIGQITRVGGASILPPVEAAKAANRLQKFLLEETRLGIPAIVHEECCSGAMILGGSMYPQMLGLASTFQPELAEAMTTEIRKQLMAIGARQGLAPVLDVARDLRWGRVEETFGEDPTLVSHFGSAYIRGLQSDDLEKGVMATAKHFVGHSLSNGGLNCGPVQVGWHELWDTFLMPFQMAFRDAKLATLMNAYPELDGEVVAASRRILTDLLRNKLGFDGLVVSDYEAVIMLHNYHYLAETPSKAGALALRAGIDVELPIVTCYGEALKAALEEGQISLGEIDLAVSRHLQKKFELGLFENPYVDEGRVLEVFETSQQRELARKIAEKSLVLLKNDGLLPLPEAIPTLAVIGPNADNPRNQLGDYSYAAVVELMRSQATSADSAFLNLDSEMLKPFNVKVGTVLEGVRDVLSPASRLLYARGCEVREGDAAGVAGAVSAAQQADAVVLVLGDYSGLVPGCTTGETRDSATLRLPEAQERLAQAVLAVGKPVVVVLVNGRPLVMPEIIEKAAAVLEAWLPGEEGGTAVAEALFGRINPGGKLPVSIPRTAGQLPVYYNHKPAGRRSNWYTDYVTEKVTPQFPFGHGLSYTRFEYSGLELDHAQAAAGESVGISLKLSNTGAVAGEEVVQLYIRDEYASTPRPVKELKGYVRVLLQPGETRQIHFHLPVNQLAFYDQTLNLVLEPGRIYVMVGASSEDIRLGGSFEISAAAQVAERQFICPVEVI